MRWNDNEITRAIRLNKNGKRFNEIAVELGRNTRSVQVKLNKLGYGENKLTTDEQLVCLNCGEVFNAKIKNKRKFCSQSCSGEYNNRKYPKRKRRDKLEKCLNCEKPLNSRQIKFCSKGCSVKYSWNITVSKIENGDTSLYESTYKKYLIYKYGDKCMKCGWNEINPITGIVPIQLEHKDGNSENNELNNLELLCPNHHSLTPTYGALNKGNGREKRRLKRNFNKCGNT